MSQIPTPPTPVTPPGPVLQPVVAGPFYAPTYAPAYTYPPPLPPAAPIPPARPPAISEAVYTQQTFGSLYLWFAILLGVGLPLCLLVIGIPAVIAAAVLQYIMIYKAWKQIQDGHARATADTAVGFCFLPFFNFYWVFTAYRGLARDMNAYTRRYGIMTPPVSEGLALTWCILLCGLAIPYLNILIALGVAGVSFFLMFQIKRAAGDIAQARLMALQRA